MEPWGGNQWNKSSFRETHISKILVLVSKISEHWREALDVGTKQNVPYAGSTSCSLLLTELPLIQTAASPAPCGSHAGNQGQERKSCLVKTLSSAKGVSECAQPSERRMLGKETCPWSSSESLLGHWYHPGATTGTPEGGSRASPWLQCCSPMGTSPSLAQTPACWGCWGALQLGRMSDLQPAAPRACSVWGWPQGKDTFQRWGSTARDIRSWSLHFVGSQQNGAAAADMPTLHSSEVNRYFSFYFD